MKEPPKTFYNYPMKLDQASTQIGVRDVVVSNADLEATENDFYEIRAYQNKQLLKYSTRVLQGLKGKSGKNKLLPSETMSQQIIDQYQNCIAQQKPFHVKEKSEKLENEPSWTSYSQARLEFKKACEACRQHSKMFKDPTQGSLNISIHEMQTDATRPGTTFTDFKNETKKLGLDKNELNYQSEREIKTKPIRVQSAKINGTK